MDRYFVLPDLVASKKKKFSGVNIDAKNAGLCAMNNNNNQNGTGTSVRT